MTSGWILCLTVICQTSAWGTHAQHNANGWQASPTVAVQQPQQSHTTTHQFGAQPRQATSQFTTQQSTGAQVDQFGRPLQNATSAQQSNPAGQVAAQHPWQTGQTQPAAQGNPQQAQSGQQFSNQQFDPRLAATQQNPSLNPSGLSQFGGNQQPNTNWRQLNNAQQTTAPQLVAPQNAAQQNTGWPAQSQTQFDPRTGQPLVNGQQNGNIGSNWLHGSQASNQPQLGGQVAQNSGQSTNQFNNSLRNPQISANVGGNGTQFGAQISLGDNRFRVADNTSHQPMQNAGNFGGNQSSLMLQPPERNTLPAGSHPQLENQTNYDPRALVQPPRIDDNSGRDHSTVNDPRWTNWNQGQDTTSVASRPTGADLQPIPANQPSNGQPPTGTVTTTHTGGNQPQTGQAGQSASTQHPVQSNEPASASKDLFAGAVRNTSNAPSLLRPNGQVGQNSNAPKYDLFAAANNARSSQENADKKKTESYDPSFAFGVSLVLNFLFFGGVLYLGWIAFESHFRYRRALLEGDDYEDSRRSSRR